MEHSNDIKESETEQGKAKIDVLLVEPGQYPKMISIDSGLESLQKEVEGYIQAVYYFDDPVALICNEEGKINGLRPNRAIYDEDGEMVDLVVGNFLITGLGEENFASLPKDLQEKYEKKFHDPEIFLRLNNRILALPTKPDKKIDGKQKSSRDAVL